MPIESRLSEGSETLGMLAETGRLLLGELIKGELDFKMEDLTEDDLIVACKVLTKTMRVDEFEAYKAELEAAVNHPDSGNKSRQVLLRILNEAATYLYT